MNEALATLTATEGVRGVIVFDAAGTCIANDLPMPYDPGLMAEAAKRISLIFDVFASMDDGTVSSFSLNCDAGGIVLRHSPPHTLIALTAPNVNMNVLTVALNVVTLNLSRRQSGTQQAMNNTRAPNSASSVHSSQLLSQSGGIPDQPIPPDAIDRQVVVQLLEVYRNYLGPAAKVVLKQQLAQLGVTSHTLRRSQFGDFVTRLAQKIPTPARQQEFLGAARDLAQRLLV
jgi:predicted regulator of Ras-like GTPase activity (Roadblock/LC7/MglB family)